MLGQALIITSNHDYAQAMKQELLSMTDNRTPVFVEMDVLRAMQMNVRQYDLIVIDQFLDRIDGLQLLRLLKAQGAQVKYAVVSDKPETALSLQAFDSGADLYIIRPTTEEAWKSVMQEIDHLVAFGAASELRNEKSIPIKRSPSGLLHVLRRDTVPLITKEEVLREAPPMQEEEMAALAVELHPPAQELESEERSSPEKTPLPNLDTRWKVSLVGELVEGSQLAAPDRCAFITYFFYRKLADIAVALEVDYFNNITLYGPHLQQVLVADNWGIHHGVFETAWATEEQREQFVKWCCEQGF